MMRILVPVLALLLGIIIALSFALRKPPAPPPNAQPAAAEQAEADVTEQSQVEPAPPTEPAPRPQIASQAEPEPVDTFEYEPIEGLGVLPPAEGAASHDVSIGSAAPGDDNPFMMRVDLVKFGAGYRQITLSRYSERVNSTDADPEHGRYVIAPPLTRPGADRPWRYPFAVYWVSINRSEPLVLATAAWTLTEQTEQAAQYELTIADGAGEPVLRIERRFELPPSSYDLNVSQRLVNLTDRPLRIVMRQWLQGDIYLTPGNYMGDQRKFAVAYFRPEYDPAQSSVFVDGAIRLRSALIDDEDESLLTPIRKQDRRLAWVANENRYFALIAHPQVTDQVQSTADLPYLDALFGDFELETDASGDAANLTLIAATTPAVALGPGESESVDLALFAGPRKRELFREAPYDLLFFNKLIRYEIGSCAFCTFQWLAQFLLWFLEVIHVVVRDWGVAIIVLVLVVRLLLHPLTKRAQVNMMTMGKKMQLLQPEMEKIKKKYKDDQTKQNQEIMKLYREKGFNPAGMVGGCLPMFLQMPIWVALYAMLYFAIELRQEPAFYGIFQLVSGGGWHFLADLSEPDNFIRFVPMGEQGLRIPLPIISMHISGINVLPLLMAVVFYFQQKFTTPPPANEQAAQQQKMMKWMVLLFPVMLYSAPSGLTLYILASTAAGILDSYMVRKHVREQEEAGTLFDKKPRKPGGMMDRLTKKLEARQQEMQKLQQKKKNKRK